MSDPRLLPTRTEQVLSAVSEQQLRALFDLATFGIVRVEPATGRFLRVNSKFCQITGYSTDELLKKTFLELAYPEDSQANQAGFQSLMRGDLPRYEIEQRYLRKDGAVVWVRVAAGVIRDGSGQALLAQAIVEDVTERKNAEEALQIRAELEDRLQNIIASVESERLAAIGSTAARLGHEIANPLNGISLGFELLEKRIAKQADSFDPELYRSINRLKNEISNLRRVVEQFRSISRKEKYHFEPSLLTELVEEVVEFQRPYFEQIRVEVEMRLPLDFPPCNIDRAKMKQVLLNLFKNAAESMPEGGRIFVDANALQRTVSVEITDTGKGIPVGFDPFEPFVTTKKDRTGIGLVIARQIVAGHHGRLSYQSRTDQGTAFRIELPRR